ncbi:finger protein [Nesidiocoris tenuis]|uniref:Finger protein n=1 Tax=Nesidiocoris tenuis TaxID=355587 RepID=A0ABN7AKW1_9HEMI|nr:finger protein [Nesidiocoris tenuis]
MDETPTGEEAPGISPAKRPIVLGVVDISGLKRSASNRKRRWDQPPCDDSEDIPTKILATDDEKESDEKAESKADCSVGLVPLDSQISDPSSSHADLNPLEEVVPSNVLGTNIDPQTAEEPTIADGIRRNRFDDKAEEARDFRDGKLDAEILLESVLPSDSSKSSTAITDYSEPLSNVAKGEIRFLTSQLSSPLENKELVNESKKAEPSDDTPDSLAQNSSAREPAFSKNSPPVSGGKSEHKIEDATLHLDDVLNVTKSDASTEKAKKPIENSVTLEAIPVKMSDSLKQILVCYDEDSNSGSESGDPIEGKVPEKEAPTSLPIPGDSPCKPHQDFQEKEDVLQNIILQSNKGKELFELADKKAKLPSASTGSSIPLREIADTYCLPSLTEAPFEMCGKKLNQESDLSVTPALPGNPADSSGNKLEGTFNPNLTEQDRGETVNSLVNLDDEIADAVPSSVPITHADHFAQNPSGKELGVDRFGITKKAVEDIPRPQGVTKFAVDSRALPKLDDRSDPKMQLADSNDSVSQQSLASKDSKISLSKQKDDTTNQDERSNSRSIEQNSQEMVDFEDWGTLKQGTSFMPVSKADDPFDSKCSLDMSLPMPGDDTSEIAQSKDVTMHFASLRSEDNVQKEEEATANEDALKLANPELTNAMKQFEEQAKMDTNTMDMLDSLVRRSSMEQSETVVEEDSLINEINLLPDREDEDTKQSDQGEDSTKPVTTSDSDNRTRLSDIPVSVPDKSRTTDGSSNGGESETEAALGSTPVQKCPIISDVESASKHSLQEQSHFGKTESQAQIEDDLSQGGEEETKAPSVTSANILEVIFGSEQKDDYAALESADSDSESKAVSVISDSRAVHSPEDGKTKSPVMASVDMQVDEDNENDEIFANAHEEPINGSPLQLADEQVQNADTEIVTVDPTAAISGEESNNDVYEIPSRDRSPITIELSDSTGDQIMVMTEASEKRIDIGATGVSDEDIDFESALDDELSFADNVLPSASSVKDLIVEEMEVDDDEEPEKKSVEEPPKEESVKSSPKLRLKITKESAEIIRDDDTIREPVDEPDREVIPRRLEVKPANSPKSLSAKEPHVPVLVIKKQALPSKKDKDKITDTLTCSPKSADHNPSEGVTLKKSIYESLQVETMSEPTPGSSPKHSPITLRIYKDNLTVKTDLDSPKRNKSPMSTEFKSELSPHLRSESSSPQNKQLEFTLKIAKDANTNQPRATMSPKTASTSCASPSSVWKSEVQILDQPPASASDGPPLEDLETEPGRELALTPTRGRGRPRGRGRGRGGSRGRGGRRGSGRVLEQYTPTVIIKQEVISDQDDSTTGQSIDVQDMFLKMLSPELSSSTTAAATSAQTKPSSVHVDTPMPRKRGRPRKLAQPPLPIKEEMLATMIKLEPPDSSMMSDSGDNDTPSSETSTGRPKRTCRGRTKPIVVKKRRGRGGGVAASGGIPRRPSTPLPNETSSPATSDLPRSSISLSPPKMIASSEVSPAGMIEKANQEAGNMENLPASSTSVPTTPNADPTEPNTPLAVPLGSPDDETPSAALLPGRGRGNFKRPTPDRNTLSEKELAELQKIEARKEKMRQDRIAKYEAKKAKKLAKKLKDEERRKRVAREKAEKAEAAAPQVFEEETRMSAPDSGSRGHTPAPNRLGPTGEGNMGDESQNSFSTPGDTTKGSKKGRMEVLYDMDCLAKDFKVDDLAEYQWQGGDLYMIQEQVSLYLGVKSFKRKYPGLTRRPVEAEERTFLEDSGLVPKTMCDLGLTAVSSAEILDIMFQDFPEKYEEFRKHVRDKQAKEASFRQKGLLTFSILLLKSFKIFTSAAIGQQRKDGTKIEPREQALEAAALWNANLNRERREERRCSLDLQTFTVHYPKLQREQMKKPTPKVGLYPIAVIPGQYCDHYKKYTSNELMYFPINTVIYGPLKPNERQKDGSEEGSNSDSSSSSSSCSSSGESSSDSESEGEDPVKCKLCEGTKKKNKESVPEVLLTCAACKNAYHPSCREFTPEMTPHLVKYEWLCITCKKCTKCKDSNVKDKIMCCQLCDRGYHLSCIGLKKMPEGRWHCSTCAYCSSCNSRNPGGSDWQHEFKKGDKGAKIYQRTLCTPCFKLWRKGKFCQLCNRCHSMRPEEDPALIQCNSCDRWLHKECYGVKYGLQNKLSSSSSIHCDYCVERIHSSSQGSSLIKV